MLQHPGADLLRQLVSKGLIDGFVEADLDDLLKSRMGAINRALGTIAQEVFQLIGMRNVE